MTDPLSQADTAIPADDPARKSTLARSEDPNLPHIGLVGDTYTILVRGKDTNGRYSLIDMHIPPGGGPPPHRHDFEEMFSILEGEIEATFRGEKTTFEPAKRLTSRRTRHTNSKTRAGNLHDCYACAPRRGRKSFSRKSVFPWRLGQGPRPHSTRRLRQHS
jgi:mannose-6-phosphate isomerase-like protein (cupin superfamily)